MSWSRTPGKARCGKVRRSNILWQNSGQRAMAELRAKGEDAIYAGSDETVYCGDEERNDRESLAEWPTAGLFLVIWGRDPTPKRSARLLAFDRCRDRRRRRPQTSAPRGRRRVAYHLVGDCKAFWPRGRPKGSAENCPARPLAASSLRWRIGLVPEPDGSVPRNCGLGGSCHRGLGQDLHQCFGG